MNKFLPEREALDPIVSKMILPLQVKDALLAMQAQAYLELAELPTQNLEASDFKYVYTTKQYEIQFIAYLLDLSKQNLEHQQQSND